MQKAHLKQVILASRFSKLMEYYFRHRKWTVLTLVVSIFLTFLILLWLHRLYSPIDSKTYISLAGTSDYEISNVEIYVKYNNSGGDDVSVYTSLTPTSNDVIGKVFLLTASPNLSYQRANSFFAGLEYEDCRPAFSMCFRFKDAAPRTIILHFNGNAFGHGGQDERLDFSLDVSKNAVLKSVPIKIVVSNLSDVNIGTIVPEPTEKGVAGVMYKFEPTKDVPGTREIIISGINRESIYSTQFQLFLLGTLLGIVLSVITTIFLDFIEKYESLGEELK